MGEYQCQTQTFKEKKILLVYMYSIANKSLNSGDPHIQLTDTGGFILFIVKHKTGI